MAFDRDKAVGAVLPGPCLLGDPRNIRGSDSVFACVGVGSRVVDSCALPYLACRVFLGGGRRLLQRACQRQIGRRWSAARPKRVVMVTTHGLTLPRQRIVVSTAQREYVPGA